MTRRRKMKKKPNPNRHPRARAKLRLRPRQRRDPRLLLSPAPTTRKKILEHWPNQKVKARKAKTKTKTKERGKIGGVIVGVRERESGPGGTMVGAKANGKVDGTLGTLGIVIGTGIKAKAGEETRMTKSLQQRKRKWRSPKSLRKKTPKAFPSG